MLTTKVVTDALKSFHDECEGHCKHAESFAPLMHEIDSMLRTLSVGAIKEEKDPIFAAFYLGVHIGYRMHQIEDAEELERKCYGEPTSH